MPRQFSTAIKGELSKRLGTEPLVLVEIEWTDGHPIAYSDRKLNNNEYPFPFLHEIGDFETTTTVTGSGDSQNVSLTLNDIDGSLRQIINTQDIHLRPVKVYLGFQGLPHSEKALMFEGVINSPIIWDEAARTLTFDIFSKLEDNEVGFTMEDGDFPFVPPADRNQAWPIVFGQVCNMETVPVTSTRKGFLAEGQGVMDPTIPDRLCQAKNLLCPEAKNVPASAIDECDWCVGGISGTPADIPENSSTGIIFEDGEGTDVADPACLLRRFNTICEIIFEKEQQQQHVKDQIEIRGGEQFPQNQIIKIQINDVQYDGIMNGTTFTIISTFHPDLEIDNPECKVMNRTSRGHRFIVGSPTNPETSADCLAGGSDFIEDIVDGSAASWEYFNEFEEGRFIWLPPGSEVFLAEESEIIHIVSLIPGTVDQVAAYRTYGETTLLSEVDPSNYTVVTSDFGDYDVVEVRLNTKLSLLLDEDWEDDIYVSFTSDVGPNPVDAIEWLIDKYTTYEIDTTSFNAIKSDLTNYPANFYLKERRNILAVLRDIAYQFRCSIFIRNNKVFLNYLSKEPSSLKTITESDIVHSTFRFSHSATEDIKTKHTINWSETDAEVFENDETELQFAIKHNVPKYGTIEAEHDYFTQNTFDTILKSATFWMIRDANTWRFVEFETPITHLDLDVFDCVTLDIEQFPTSKIVITSTSYNADSNTIKFEAWTPILSGTESEYFWAWPALKSANAVFPLIEQASTIGDGSGLNVTPPEGHPLRSDFDPETARIETAGDKNPSDLDDEFPTLECRVATGQEVQDTVEPIIRPFEPLAEDNFEDELKEKERGIGGAAPGDDDDDEDDPVPKEPKACGEPTGGDSCVFEVNVQYGRADKVTQFGCSGPCGCEKPGKICFGPVWSLCHSFSNEAAANAFYAEKRQEAFAHQNCEKPVACGGEAVITVNPVVQTVSHIQKEVPDDSLGAEEGDTKLVNVPCTPGEGDGEISSPSTVPGSPDPPEDDE